MKYSKCSLCGASKDAPRFPEWLLSVSFRAWMPLGSWQWCVLDLGWETSSLGDTDLPKSRSYVYDSQ